MRASGLSLEGRCILLENVCNFEIIPSPRQLSGFSPLYRSFPDKRRKLRLRMESSSAMYNEWWEFQCFSERRCMAGDDGHFARTLNPFTPESDQCQNSLAASQEIWHHTVWRTWLFIAYSDVKWLYYKFSLHHSYNRFLKGWENTLFELRSERVKRHAY